MRAPPPLRVTLQPSRAARVAVAVLVALASAALGAWLLSHAAAPAACGLLAAPLAAALAWRWGPSQAAELGWDGQRWWCGGVAGSVSLRLDLQRWLVLRWRAHQGHAWRWLVVDVHGLGADTTALRVALHHARGGVPVLLP
jgi:hypothetical protein